MNHKVFIIGEAGVNHNGSITIAKQLIDIAAWSGVDAVKFQTFKAELSISKFAEKAAYQKKTTNNAESHLDMAKKLELPFEAFRELFSYCKQKNILFLSTPFDMPSIDLLIDLGLEIMKIPSGEITNLPYLRKIGSLNKRIILSTGMSYLKEVQKTLEVLIQAGSLKENIVLLHCNSEYPTPIEDVNLLAMLAMRDAFGVSVGYSDHTIGLEVPIAAVALGGTVIEKHFTIDRTMKGPDHKASLEPRELKEMVTLIRNIEKALGDGIKRPSSSEEKNLAIARKSIVAARHIEKGEFFTKENITVKRPGTGICPMNWDSVIGRAAVKIFDMDELIKL